jgi:hypothetical protein
MIYNYLGNEVDSVISRTNLVDFSPLHRSSFSDLLSCRFISYLLSSGCSVVPSSSVKISVVLSSGRSVFVSVVSVISVLSSFLGLVLSIVSRPFVCSTLSVIILENALSFPDHLSGLLNFLSHLKKRFV